MCRQDHEQGQTGIAILALLVALVALGVAIYTSLHAVPRDGLHTQLNKVEKLIEQGRQETADALKGLEEHIRGSQPQETPQGSKTRSLAVRLVDRVALTALRGANQRLR
jgi:hypothetical protein